jgi:hypothetical protein
VLSWGELRNGSTKVLSRFRRIHSNVPLAEKYLWKKEAGPAAEALNSDTPAHLVARELITEN